MALGQPTSTANGSRSTKSRRNEKCEPEILVLFSGGIDSSALLAFYLKLERPVAGLYVNYGHVAASCEIQAAKRISRQFGVPLLQCEWQGLKQKHAGPISGRNAFLLFAALMEAPSSTTTIAIGIHAGTPYVDCTSEFIDRLQSICQSYESSITIAAPFADWSKADIFSFASAADVPVNLTYSCETGSTDGCGLCASCRDRTFLYART